MSEQEIGEIIITPEQLEELMGSEDDEQPSRVVCGSDQRAELRSLIITGPVSEDMAAATSSRLLSFAAECSESPIALYVNTYGGSAYDMMALYDVIQFIKPPVYTIGFGKVMSAGVLLLACGEKGHRYALPHTSLMIHKVKGGAIGAVEDIESSGEHMKGIQKNMEKLLAKHTTIGKKAMREFMSGADTYLTAKQARDLGIIDNVTAVMPRVMI